jgi:hypothetical protein
MGSVSLLQHNRDGLMCEQTDGCCCLNKAGFTRTCSVIRQVIVHLNFNHVLWMLLHMLLVHGMWWVLMHVPLVFSCPSGLRC